MLLYNIICVHLEDQISSSVHCTCRYNANIMGITIRSIIIKIFKKFANTCIFDIGLYLRLQHCWAVLHLLHGVEQGMHLVMKSCTVWTAKRIMHTMSICMFESHNMAGYSYLQLHGCIWRNSVLSFHSTMVKSLLCSN